MYSIFILSSLLIHTLIIASYSKPNIILILVDDWGYADIGYLGGDIPTPTIDELASQGIRLNYHYAENVCSATRSALLTGRYAWKSKLDDVLAFPSNQSTDVSADLISDILVSGGYETVFTGKWHIGSAMKTQLPSLRGFQQSLYFSQGMINYTKHDHCLDWGSASLQGITDGDIQIPPDSNTIPLLVQSIPEGFCGYDLWYNDHASFMSQDTGGYSEDIFADYINSYLYDYTSDDYDKNRKKRKPFFIYYSMPTPHTPITVPPRTSAQCDNLIGETRRTQCNMMYYADLLIKQLVDQLKRTKLYDNTLILFLSDNGAQPLWPVHGESAGQPLPFRGAKTNTFEGGVRTPAFISGGYLAQTLRTGCDYNHLVYVADFYSVIAHFAGVEYDDEAIDSINIWHDIESECNCNRTPLKPIRDRERREEIISFRLSAFEDNMFIRAFLRTDKYKLLVNPNIFGHPLVQWDYLENWVNYDAVYYVEPNETYYTLHNEYDSTHYDQGLFYSKCYEDYLANPDVYNLSTDAHMIGDDKVYLFDIKQDNIEACNIASDEVEIVEELMNRMKAQIPLYRGSGGIRGDKGAYAGVRNSYDCEHETFFYIPWADDPQYQSITDDWNTIMLSFIDQVNACGYRDGTVPLSRTTPIGTLFEDIFVEEDTFFEDTFVEEDTFFEEDTLLEDIFFENDDLSEHGIFSGGSASYYEMSFSSITAICATLFVALTFYIYCCFKNTITHQRYKEENE